MPERASAVNGGDADFAKLLVDPIVGGRCVLLLGPGVAVDPGDPAGVPLTTMLARQLASDPEAEIAEGDRHRDSLRYVAERYARTVGRDRLECAVADFYQQYAGATTPFHSDLAVLPFSLCIATSPDHLMLNAFKACRGKEPRSAHYNFRTTVVPPPQPSAQAPLVYHLYGGIEDRLSLVLGESDLLDFLVAVVRNEPELPKWMRALLSKRETAFLFLGFGFQNWHVRVLLHTLNMIESHRGYALEDRTFFEHPECRQTVGFFKKSGQEFIKFQQVSWAQFASSLRAACRQSAAAAMSGGQPAADAPYVFLSYARDDQQAADLLASRLEARRVRVWQDVQSLRAGDRWEQVIDRIVGKVVDYVVVLQSAAMTRRDQGVYNAEIALALARQRTQRETLRFVLPVRVDDAPPLERLSAFHAIDVRSEAGVDSLVLAIQEDRERRREPRADAA